MIPTSYDNLGWADDSLISWPSWIENSVVPNLTYGDGLLPGYYDSGETAVSASFAPLPELGYPEMPQPAPTSSTYGVEMQPRVASINTTASTVPISNQPLTYNQVQPESGNNSQTWSAASNVLGDVLDNLKKEHQYQIAERGYNIQAQALAERSESAYKIAGTNMMRLRGNQERYLTQQRVAAVRTGFAPTSGSIEAVQRGTMSKFEQQIADSEREAEQSRQDTMYRSRVMSWRAGQARKAAKQARTSMWGSIIGSTIGAVVGGPVGMRAGSKIGSSIGGFS